VDYGSESSALTIGCNGLQNRIANLQEEIHRYTGILLDIDLLERLNMRHRWERNIIVRVLVLQRP